MPNRKREDMQVFTHQYQGNVYCYQLPDHSIETYDGGKHFVFCVQVWKQTDRRDTFMINFRLPAEEIDSAMFRANDEIERHLSRE